MASVVSQLEQLLQRHEVQYELMRHQPVYTSAEAAAVRGTPLSSGAKALVVRLHGQPRLFVLPADCKLSSRKVRSLTGARSIRFASAEEVLEYTGLRPGAIPPFGSLFGLSTVCDPRLAQNPTINFNAGDHAVSISISYHDYLKVERPELADVSDKG